MNFFYNVYIQRLQVLNRLKSIFKIILMNCTTSMHQGIMSCLKPLMILTNLYN